MAISRPTMKSHPFKAAPFRLSNTLTNLYSLGCAQSFGRLELHIEVHVEFTSARALYWLANEEARVRIGVDAVRGIGPLRMIRRKVDSAAVTARVLCMRHLLGLTEVEGNTVLEPVSLLILVPGHRENLMALHHTVISLDCPTC